MCGIAGAIWNDPAVAIDRDEGHPSALELGLVLVLQLRHAFGRLEHHLLTRLGEERLDPVRLAAAAATVYRNYFAPVRGMAGQTQDRQLDTLAAPPAAAVS